MVRFKETEREQQQSETRERLLDAAAAEFSREGYNGANINRISLDAGYAKGTVYNYFESKRFLMLKLIDEVARHHFEFVSQQVLEVADPVERLTRFYRSGFRYVEENYNRARVMAQTIFGVDAEFKAHIYQAYLPFFELVNQSIITPGIEQGVFMQVDPEQTSALVMTLYLGTGTQTDETGRIFMDPGTASKFVLNALRPDSIGL